MKCFIIVIIIASVDDYDNNNYYNFLLFQFILRFSVIHSGAAVLCVMKMYFLMMFHDLLFIWWFEFHCEAYMRLRG